MTKTLDKIDRRILAIVAENGRIGWNELAEQVGLSTTPVVRRLRILEESGYILGYGARLDEVRLGRSVNVFVSVTLDSQRREVLALFEERVAQMPEVMSCFMISGGTDYLLRVVVADLDAYREFVAESLSAVPGIARLSSSFALKAVLQRSFPPMGSGVR